MYLCVFFLLKDIGRFYLYCSWTMSMICNSTCKFYIKLFATCILCILFFFEWWRIKYTCALPAFIWTDISIIRCMSCWGKLHTTELWPRQSVMRGHLAVTVCSDWRSRGSTSTLRRPAQVGGPLTQRTYIHKHAQESLYRYRKHWGGGLD